MAQCENIYMKKSFSQICPNVLTVCMHIRVDRFFPREHCYVGILKVATIPPPSPIAGRGGGSVLIAPRQMVLSHELFFFTGNLRIRYHF